MFKAFIMQQEGGGELSLKTPMPVNRFDDWCPESIGILDFPHTAAKSTGESKLVKKKSHRSYSSSKMRMHKYLLWQAFLLLSDVFYDLFLLTMPSSLTAWIKEFNTRALTSS